MKYIRNVFWIRWIAAVWMLAILSACSSTTMIHSVPPGAKVYADGNFIGSAPIPYKDNKVSLSNTRFRLEKEGYDPLEVVVMKDEEAHVGAIIGGIFFILPWLWILQYKPERTYELKKSGQSDPQRFAKQTEAPVTQMKQTKPEVSIPDIDQNVPDLGVQHPMRFALIIGNEDYSTHQLDLSSEANVAYARNDAETFRRYARLTLGVPEQNIIFLLDGTTGQMRQAIQKLHLILKNTQGKAEAFVYFAGHGMPDEITRDAYLMPVDVSGKQPTDGISLRQMYQKFSEYPAQHVTLFLDACFSGGARNQGMLAARAVKIVPKQEAVPGNLIVFAATSGEQSALPLDAQKHGMFTYHLLKKLQESRGSISYKEMFDYLNTEVALQSVLLNNKEQNPQIMPGSDIIAQWEGLRFVK